AIHVAFPFTAPELAWAEVAAGLQREGFIRAVVGDEVLGVEVATPSPGDALHIVVDRLVVKAEGKQRLVGSLEQALHYGKGRLRVVVPGGARRDYSATLACDDCAITYRASVANLFSFNSPVGACETCRGFGRVIDLDLDLVFPDVSRSLAAGAVKPWTTPSTSDERAELLTFCRR